MVHPRVIIVKILKMLKINRIAHKIYYKYVHGFNSAGKELIPTIEKCIDKAIEFGTTEKGDHCEFGIFKGHTFAHATNYASKKQLKMRSFGFDSFQGLPEIEGIDDTGEEHFYEGQYCAPVDQVKKDMDTTGVDWNKTFLIEGFFNESLNDGMKEKYKLDKIAIAHIDCDLYSSTVDVLNFIKDMIMDKTILIFDDYDTYNADDELGQRKAFKEFLAENNSIKCEEWFTYGAYGHVFIVHKN